MSEKLNFLNFKVYNDNGQVKDYKIQMLRALAIIAVILIHTCPGENYQAVFRPFINYAVALFLFLSGYLTRYTSDIISFYKKRIFRVLIPYVIWNVLYTLSNKEPALILKNIITTKSSAHLYYVFVYIQFVLLTPLLFKLAKSKFKYAGFVISPISVILFKYISLLTGSDLNKYVSLAWSVCCIGWFSYYYLGLLLGNRLLEKDFNLIKLIIAYVISLIIQIIEGFWWLSLGEANCGTQLKLSALLSSSLFLLLVYSYLRNERFNKKSKFLILIGNYSFGIYLSHMMVMKVLYLIPFYPSVPYIINSACVLIVSLVFVLIGNKICGRKISKWLGLI